MVSALKKGFSKSWFGVRRWAINCFFILEELLCMSTLKKLLEKGDKIRCVLVIKILKSMYCFFTKCISHQLLKTYHTCWFQNFCHKMNTPVFHRLFRASLCIYFYVKSVVFLVIFCKVDLIINIFKNCLLNNIFS